MKSLYTTLILLLSSFSIGLACSCAYIPTFCETITYGSDAIDSSYLIVYGRVESKSSLEMQVKVLTVLSGSPDGNTIIIPQGYGADCRESIDHFDIDKEFIFALRGTSQGYFLSICGINYLPVFSGMITGNIAPGVEQIRVSEFGSIESCTAYHPVLTQIDVTPTLTSGNIEVSTTKDISSISIAMYDMVGRRVYAPEQDTLLEAEPLVIPGNRFPSGCYTVVAEVAGIRRAFKVVIVS